MINKRVNDIKKIEKFINKLTTYQYLTHGLKQSLRRTLKEIKLYKNHIRGIKELSNKKKRLNTTRIQIGGGRHILKGYLNIDIVPPADIIYDVREGLPLNDECSELIFSEHFLEHIDYPLSVKKFIKECYRILKTDGIIIIGVPNSELVIKNYCKRDYRFYKKLIKLWYSKRNCLEHFNTYIDLVNYHFRDQNDDKKYNPHFWSYDYEKLYNLLKAERFNNIKHWKFNKNIANPKRKYGSIYIIAKK